jgi:hypothetical protein
VAIAQGVHRLPEAVVVVNRELSLGGQALERFLFPEDGIALD